MLRIAFAGFRHGHIFELYNLVKEHADVEIAATWEENEQVKQQLFETRGIEFTHDSFEEILNDESIDAVAIGDYYGIRGALAIKALSAGKHIIADKPLCTSLEELSEIERLSKEKDLEVSCMFSMHYFQTVETAHDIIGSGKLGKINAVYFAGQHPLQYGIRPSWYFEEGKHGGTINDIAIHGIDIIRYVTGLSLKRVLSSRCWNFYAKEVPCFKDSAQFMAELDGGAGVIADVSYAAPNSIGFKWPDYWHFTFWGEKGVLKFSANSDSICIALDGDTEPHTIECGDRRDDVLTNFIKAINGEEHTLTTEDVINASREVLLIQKASE